MEAKPIQINVPLQNGLLPAIQKDADILMRFVPMHFGESHRSVHFPLQAGPESPVSAVCVLYPIQQFPRAGRQSVESVKQCGAREGLLPVSMLIALSLIYCHKEALGTRRIIFTMDEPFIVCGNGKDIFPATLRWDDTGMGPEYPMPVQAGPSDMFGYPCEVGRFDLFPSTELLSHIPRAKRWSCLHPELKVVPVTHDCSRESFAVFMRPA
ncbi:MAG: hypothetical protein EXS51_03980 [Candidatus Taylorbacteria bacterium]|nr:hypothetical protein [Candidatus Taylorbacteria bacterium]